MTLQRDKRMLAKITAIAAAVACIIVEMSVASIVIALLTFLDTPRVNSDTFVSQN
eukprot:SAG11_NODE_14772_length_600_cov_0.976048_1_plen_55_part_00